MAKFKILSALTLVMVMASMATAEWVPLPGDPVSIEDIGEQPFIVGDKVFTDFEVFGISAGGALPPDAGSIFVLGGMDSETEDYGIKLTLGWEADQNQSVNVRLRFKVSIMDDAAYDDYYIKDVWAELVDPAAAGSGLVAASETVLDGPVPGGDLLASLELSYQENDGGANMVDHEVFEPVREVWITKDIGISGGSADGGSASLSGLIQYYSQIPEPMTLSLLAVGALPLLRRRKG